MTRRVAVVGAGIIGLCCAWYLRERGFEVTVLEREGPERFTTSFINAGMLVPSHVVPLAAPGAVAQGIRWMRDPRSPFWIRPRPDPELLSWGLRFWRAANRRHVERSIPVLLQLHRASLEAYRDLLRLQDDAGGPDGGGLVERGLLMLCHTEAGLAHAREEAAHAVAAGMAVSVLDAAAVRELEPDMELDVHGAIHYHEDAHLDPGAFMRMLQASLESRGVEFSWHTEVTGASTEGGRLRTLEVTRAGRGLSDAGVATVDADEYVLAAGVWSSGLARDLGLRLPMQAGKGYSMTLEDVPANLRHPAILTEARVAVTPLGRHLRIGGTMELGRPEAGVNPQRVEGIVSSALACLRGLDEAALRAAPVSYGFRPCSPDGMPYLGRPARNGNLTVATGHGMMGLSLGPVSGRIVAALVAGESPGMDLTAIAPDRYSRRPGAGA